MALQTEAVEATARSCVQEIVGTAVASSTPLMEAGIDSLGATELQRALGEHLSTEFEATLLFDHPSIEAIVSRFPSPISPPANPDQISSYTAAVPIPDAYQGAMLDWLCFRAFGKDQDIPATAQRAAGHYQAFAQAIGLKAQADMAYNVHTPEG